MHVPCFSELAGQHFHQPTCLVFPAWQSAVVVHASPTCLPSTVALSTCLLFMATAAGGGGGSAGAGGGPLPVHFGRASMVVSSCVHVPPFSFVILTYLPFTFIHLTSRFNSSLKALGEQEASPHLASLLSPVASALYWSHHWSSSTFHAPCSALYTIWYWLF